MSVKAPHPSAVVRVSLGWTLAPERAARLVRDDPRPFALIGRWAGGGAVIGSEPVRIAAAGDDPFALLEEQPPLRPAPRLACDPDAHAGVIGGGWFGWLGYELRTRIETSAPGPLPLSGAQPFRLAYYDHLLHLDPEGRWWFEALWTPPRAEALRERLRVLRQRASTPPRPRTFATEGWQATPGGSGHALAVAACRERIRAGDLFQANICVRLESRLSGSPLDLFIAAVQKLKPDRAAFLSDPDGAVASLSPELFLERHGRHVRSAPIKGTRPRPADPGLAAVQRQALMTSEKDRAENVMIVDLVRNDLGRVCVPGSVQVETLCEVRPHAGVWHLVSEVAGVVRDGVGNGDLVRAAFPPGSVTGAPKVAAMDVVAELESSPRELYTGAIGFASPVAGLELSVAIRTFEFRGAGAWLGVGGGIVADSDPHEEARECHTKAAPLLGAIGATLQRDKARPEAPPLTRLGPRPIARPDPAAGVFETLLVLDGRPIALESHLERLAASVQALYGQPLPPGLEQELLAAAWQRERARLRLNAVVERGDVLTEIVVSAPRERRIPVLLRPVTLPGGLGAHKWIDRGLLDALSREARAEPLLCDLDGVVLEAARANVFVVEGGGRLATPRADGRVLPGVTRAGVLELAAELGLETCEEPIELDRLRRADEIFVTGALGGVEPALLAGSVTSAGGQVTERLAHAWRVWSRESRSPDDLYSGAERLMV